MGVAHMTKESLDQQWDQLRQKYSSYLRLLEAIPADRYHTRLFRRLSASVKQ